MWRLCWARHKGRLELSWGLASGLTSQRMMQKTGGDESEWLTLAIPAGKKREYRKECMSVAGVFRYVTWEENLTKAKIFTISFPEQDANISTFNFLLGRRSGGAKILSCGYNRDVPGSHLTANGVRDPRSVNATAERGERERLLGGGGEDRREKDEWKGITCACRGLTEGSKPYRGLARADGRWRGSMVRESGRKEMKAARSSYWMEDWRETEKENRKG